MFGRRRFVIFCLLGGLAIPPVSAHEGHDHDSPAQLNLPVAPRVVAVTPELELVGVVSGQGRLTVFLHTYATNEPIKGAKMTISADNRSGAAEPRGDGVFNFSAPWLASTQSIDLVFALTLADGSQDLLTGQLNQAAVLQPTVGSASALGGVELSPFLGDGRAGQAAAVAGWRSVCLAMTSNPFENFTPRISFGNWS